MHICGVSALAQVIYGKHNKLHETNIHALGLSVFLISIRKSNYLQTNESERNREKEWESKKPSQATLYKNQQLNNREIREVQKQ